MFFVIFNRAWDEKMVHCNICLLTVSNTYVIKVFYIKLCLIFLAQEVAVALMINKKLIFYNSCHLILCLNHSHNPHENSPKDTTNIPLSCSAFYTCIILEVLKLLLARF